MSSKSDKPNAETLNGITEKIIGGAISVHRELGPGLLESAYEACLAYELSLRGLRADRQVQLPVVYRDTRVDCGHRIDLLGGLSHGRTLP